MPIMFVRRLGMKNGPQCSQGYSCPQILEKTDGNFAVVGTVITQAAVAAMPPGPGVGPKEGVVEVPKAVMLSAMADYLASAA